MYIFIIIYLQKYIYIYTCTYIGSCWKILRCCSCRNSLLKQTCFRKTIWGCLKFGMRPKLDGDIW